MNVFGMERKAVFAAVSALLGALGTAAVDDGITLSECLLACSTFVAVLGGVAPAVGRARRGS